MLTTFIFLFIQIEVDVFILLVPLSQILILSIVGGTFDSLFRRGFWQATLTKRHDCLSMSDNHNIQVENGTSVANLPAAASVAVLHLKAKRYRLHPYEIVITTDLQCHGARHCFVVLSLSALQLML